MAVENWNNLFSVRAATSGAVSAGINGPRSAPLAVSAATAEGSSRSSSQGSSQSSEDGAASGTTTGVAGRRTSSGLSASVAGSSLTAGTDSPEGLLVWTGDVYGPSVGLPFALAMLDRQVPGPLAGPLVVAATGAIAGDGTVGPVGGVTEKYRAAVAARADVFFIPAGNMAEFEGRAELHGGPRIIPVDSLDEAIAYLCALGHGSACR